MSDGGSARSVRTMSSEVVPDRGEVHLEIADDVAVVTLDRPSAHNALTVYMLNRLSEVMNECEQRADVRAIVLTGAGARAFCAGGDLEELIPRLTSGELEILISDPSKRFFSDVLKPVVAAVNGICVAAGLEMLLGTDLRVASDSATFGLPEVKWGLIPGGGSHVRLPQQVPWAFAMQLLLTGDHVPAQRAYEVGLVNEVVSSERVLDRGLELAHGMARNAPLAMRSAKAIAVRALQNEARFILEHAINRTVVASADAVEGPRAFIEKRRPRYLGN
ncbi:MAG: enoyl-CoA hydratase-related protein [Acidimicrobiales bacterium]